MPKWTPRRAARARRRPDGTFRLWTGGRTLASLPKKQNNYHGIAVHLGLVFKAHHGRKARVGDVWRTRNKDGTYSGHAWWYVRTRHGWRKVSPEKPTAAQLRRVMESARPGSR